MGPFALAQCEGAFGRSGAKDLATPEFWTARSRFSGGENSGDDRLLPDDWPA